MPRYIITNRCTGKRTPAERRASRKALEDVIKKIPSAQIHADLAPEQPTGRRTIVIEAEPDQIRAITKRLSPDVIIEPEIQHKLHATPAVGQRSLLVGVRGGVPLEAARVTILHQDGDSLSALPPVLTDGDGNAELRFPDSIEPLFALAEPWGGFWPMFTDHPRDRVNFACPSLPKKGGLEWWHKALGVSDYDERRGRGIRIGVVGTGVGPHPRLRRVTLIDGKKDIDWHETHVCGVIAAHYLRPGEFAGIAPGAEVFSACVYQRSPSGEIVAEHQGVIAHAIDRLAESEKHNGYGVDLINLSFGEAQRSKVLHDAIRYALERGVLCICSAGNNSGGALDYPAALRETVAVTALGKTGWGPEHSTTSHWVPKEKDKFGARGLYLAGMSSTGKGVFCAAPGNGIISTIPARAGRQAPYASMDGTSLASPMACGALAVLLSGFPAYLALPRTARRAQRAKAVLRQHCASIGLKIRYQGAGVPAIG